MCGVDFDAVEAGGLRVLCAVSVLRDGAADLVSFATLFIANPDLPKRLRHGAPFNSPYRKTYYGGAAKGYTDYPRL